MAFLRRELGLETKIWLLTSVVALATTLAYLGLVQPIGTGPSELDVPWWLVAAGFAAAERWVVHLHFRRSTHSLSLGELPLVAGLLFLPAHELVLAGLVGSSVALAFDREIPTFKAFFNLAQFTLATCVALFVIEGLVGVRDPLDPMVWLAVFAAVSAATLIADICVGAAVTIAEGQLEAQQRIDMLLTNWTVALSNTCLALAIAAVVAARPEGGLLLVPPTVLLMAAYRAYLSERRRNAELEFLYEATRTLSRSSEIQPELEALLARTASAFRVDAVDLVLFSAEPNRSARSSLSREGGARMLEQIDEPLGRSPAGSPGLWKRITCATSASVGTSSRAAWRTACSRRCTASPAASGCSPSPAARAWTATSPRRTCACSKRSPATSRSRSSTTASSRPCASSSRSSRSSSARRCTTR
jgi:4-hydroxybenzoate polyprenyltransferase